jgi:hypothetical protein
MINATEIDILPRVRGDLEEPSASAGAADLGAILLPLIVRGWIEVSSIDAILWSWWEGSPCAAAAAITSGWSGITP